MSNKIVGYKAVMEREVSRVFGRGYMVKVRVTTYNLFATKGFRRASRKSTSGIMPKLPYGWPKGYSTVTHLIMGEDLGRRMAKLLDVA